MKQTEEGINKLTGILSSWIGIHLVKMAIVHNAFFIIKFNAVSFAKELRNLGELRQNPCLKATHLLKHVLEEKTVNAQQVYRSQPRHSDVYFL